MVEVKFTFKTTEDAFSFMQGLMPPTTAAPVTVPEAPVPPFPIAEAPAESAPEAPAPKRRGRPKKADAPAEPVAEAPVEPEPAPAPAPAPAPVKAKTPHEEVREVLTALSQSHGIPVAKSCLPEGVPAVKDLSVDQCAEVIAKAKAIATKGIA